MCIRDRSKPVRILFPILITVIAGIIAPRSVALVGFLMFGNLIRECGVLASLSPVSYTHLDVYKRQKLIRLKNALIKSEEFCSTIKIKERISRKTLGRIGCWFLFTLAKTFGRKFLFVIEYSIRCV